MKCLRRSWLCGLLVILSGSVCLTGCTYLNNRVTDLSQVINTGVTVSKTPQFSLYIDLFSVLPLGYSNFDGTLYGYAEGHVGAFRTRQESAGLLLWGREQFAWGNDTFKPEDPDSPPSWRVGAIGLSKGPCPPKKETVNSPKLLHLGWIGITIYCRPNEMADFALGSATIDIMGDDAAASPKKPEEPPTPKPGSP